MAGWCRHLLAAFRSGGASPEVFGSQRAAGVAAGLSPTVSRFSVEEAEKLLSRREFDVASVLMLHREPPAPATEIPASQQRELADVLQSLKTAATSDSVRQARRWMEAQAAGREASKALAFSMRRQQRSLQTATHKLHALYLVHDFVQVRGLAV